MLCISHGLNYFSDYVPISACIIFTLITTSCKCLIPSHMPSSFTTEKQNSLFIQSDKKIWGLHRSKYHTPFQACKKAQRNCLCHTTYSKGPLHSPPVPISKAATGKKLPLTWITTGPLTGTGVLTWMMPRNFSLGRWKNFDLYIDVSFPTWNDKNSISLLGFGHTLAR